MAQCLVITSDLMGYSQLAGVVRSAGLEPKQVRGNALPDTPTDDVRAIVVDLMDPHGGPDAVAAAHRLGVPVFAVAPHVRQDLFSAGRAQGAREVLPHSAVTTRLPQILRALLQE